MTLRVKQSCGCIRSFLSTHTSVLSKRSLFIVDFLVKSLHKSIVCEILQNFNLISQPMHLAMEHFVSIKTCYEYTYFVRKDLFKVEALPGKRMQNSKVAKRMTS